MATRSPSPCGFPRRRSAAGPQMTGTSRSSAISSRRPPGAAIHGRTATPTSTFGLAARRTALGARCRARKTRPTSCGSGSRMTTTTRGCSTSGSTVRGLAAMSPISGSISYSPWAGRGSRSSWTGCRRSATASQLIGPTKARTGCSPTTTWRGTAHTSATHRSGTTRLRACSSSPKG